MILIIDNYDSFTYNLAQLIGELGYPLRVERNDKIIIDQIRELNPDKIIISPGPGRPEGAGISLDLIKELAGEIPILGICLGHQSLGAAFGGKIIKAPQLFHGKTSKVVNKGGRVLKGIGDFEATRYHSLIIDPDTLPSRYKVTAQTEGEIIMGIEDEKAGLYGLQFHPESIMTEVGRGIISNFLKIEDKE
ncbi:anthranilate synthase component II [Halonatronum saccharophilum]|uniref:anthranilate synthase component II n=1 Tax=Halonatronum saccharophilum TaxID=150060 RepID=UPI0004806ED9|nr:aminodeoxychorismate/anthranilate synthase component II [Halonatronum saccharophilum]